MKAVRSPSFGERSDTSHRQTRASKEKSSVDVGPVPQSAGRGSRPGGYTMISWPLRERIVQLAFGSAVAVLVAVGSLAYHSVLASNDSSAWVRHTLEVLENLQDTQLAMETIVESARGFVLTGDETYLERYQTNLSSLAQHEAAVRSLTVDNPEQQRRITALEKITAEREQRAKTNISLRREQGLAAAADVIRSGSGQQATGDICRRR